MWDGVVKWFRGDQDDSVVGEDTDADRPSSDVDRIALTNQRYDSTVDTSDTDVLTVDQIFDAIGFGWFQVKMMFILGTTWLAVGMVTMIINILVPAVRCAWMVSPWQEAVLSSVVFVGMVAFSGFWGKLADVYGRKKVLLLSTVFVLYFGVLSSFSPNYAWLVILRFIVGIGIGGDMQLLTFYAEFVQSSLRATCIVVVEIFWTIGGCLIVTISIFVMPTLGWRYLLAISALPVSVFFFTCCWLPESPRFDIARGMPEQAMTTLKRIADDNGKPMPPGKLVDVVQEAEGQVERGQFKDLFVPELRLTTVLVWFNWFVAGIAYYGVILMSTELLQLPDVCYGGEIQGVTDAENTCRVECVPMSTEDYVDLLVTTVAEIPGLLILILLMETIGRRMTFVIEFFLFAYFVLLINFCVERTVLTVFLFIARGLAIGVYLGSFVYTPEVYPTTVRALSVGVGSGISHAGSIITPFISELLLHIYLHIAISLYTLFGILAGIGSLLLPIETKGRQMTDFVGESLDSKPQPITSDASSTH